MKGFKCLLEEGKTYKCDGLWYKVVNGKIFMTNDAKLQQWHDSAVNAVLSSDYEEVPVEVTWQKALEVWASGKMILCIYDGDEYKIHADDVIDRELVAKGKWYII